jgi:hypothetical protein
MAPLTNQITGLECSFHRELLFALTARGLSVKSHIGSGFKQKKRIRQRIAGNLSDKADFCRDLRDSRVSGVRHEAGT